MKKGTFACRVLKNKIKVLEERNLDLEFALQTLLVAAKSDGRDIAIFPGNVTLLDVAINYADAAMNTEEKE